MIATDALPHVAHKSTVENRRKNLNLRDIEHLSLCLWCSMALWAKSGLFGQGEGWRIHFKQNLDVTSRAYGLQAELEPYIIFLRVLWERYKDDLDGDDHLEGARIRLTTFPTDGIGRAARLLD